MATKEENNTDIRILVEGERAVGRVVASRYDDRALIVTFSFKVAMPDHLDNVDEVAGRLEKLVGQRVQLAILDGRVGLGGVE